MKKTYIIPQIEIVVLNSHQPLMIGSVTGTGVMSGNADNSYGVLAREGYYFEDEE